MSRVVSDFDNIHNGSVYIYGKGCDIESHERRPFVPIIGVNDVGVVYDCVNYTIVGSDDNNKDWLGRSRLHYRHPVFSPDRSYHYSECYKYVPCKFVNHCLEGEKLYIENNLTASSAIGLAKRMGFSSAIMIGFGSEHYAIPWRSDPMYNPLEYEIDRNPDGRDLDSELNPVSRIEHKNFLINIGEKLDIQVEVI